jgi:hypothetical protein
LAKLSELAFVPGRDQQGRLGSQWALSGVRATTMEPTSPKEEREVHSSPLSFNIVTLTAKGSDRTAWSTVVAFVEKVGRSC